MAGPNLQALWISGIIVCVSILLTTGKVRKFADQGWDILKNFDRNCSITGVDGALIRCRVTRLRPGIAGKILSSKLATNGNHLPGGPRKPSVKLPQDLTDMSVQIVWGQQMANIQKLKHFLVQITINYFNKEGKRNSSCERTDFFNLTFIDKMTPVAKRYSTKFALKFLSVPENVADITASVLSLPALKKPYKEVRLELNMAHSTRMQLDRGNRLTAYNCLCDVRDHIDSYSGPSSNTVRGSITLKQWNDRVEVFLKLYYTESNKEASLNTIHQWNNKTGTLTIKYESEKKLPKGRYRLKMERKCDSKYKGSTWSNNCNGAIYEIEDFYIQAREPGRESETSSENSRLEGRSQNDVSAWYAGLPDWMSSMLASVVTVSSLALLLVLVASLIRYILYQIRFKGSRTGVSEASTSTEDGATSITALLPYSGSKRTGSGHDRVAIIYTHDSECHRQAVYCLEGLLTCFDVDVTVVDEYKSTDMWKNWVDFTERLTDTHKQVIFVVSQGMYQMCHEYKYGNERKYTSLLNQYNGRCVPVVMINVLNTLNIQQVSGKVKTFVVSFSPEQPSTRDLLKQFVGDHHILNNGFFYRLLTYKDKQSRLSVNEEDIVHLVSHIKGEPWSKSYLDSSLEHIRSNNHASRMLSLVSTIPNSLYTVLPSINASAGSEFYV